MKKSLILVTIIGLMLALSTFAFGQSTPVKKKGKAKVTIPKDSLSGEDNLEVKKTNNLSGEDDFEKTQKVRIENTTWKVMGMLDEAY